jgi:hypothetical protein
MRHGATQRQLTRAGCALDACSKFLLGLIQVQMGKQLPSRLELFY